MGASVITFLSDYGLTDDFVGVVHGVIARICPQAQVIDLTHGLARHDVRAGALVMEGALPYLPVAVHLAVVDPDVGAERRAVALRLADDRLLVGPDNGLLSLAAEKGGGVVEAVDISTSKFRLEPVSATFHGRDIFGPVAAQLAAGVALAETGPPVDPEHLVRIELPSSRLDDGALVAHAVYVDRFGNVQLDAEHEQIRSAGLRLGHPLTIEVGSRVEDAQYARTFADAPSGALLAYEDAYGRLALAVSHGDAAERLRVAVDDELRLKPA